MRRKPSMFSKNYRKELKQRKIRRMILFLGVILIIGGGAVSYYKGSIVVNNFFANNKNNGVIEQNNQQVSEDETNTEEIKKLHSTFEVSLSSGKIVLIEIEEENNKKKIVNIQCPEAVKGDISPMAEKGLIVDELHKDIYIVDIEGKIINVTNQQYIATNKEVFTKEVVLQYSPEHKWVEDAAFIDEEHVAYSSELPWINEGGELYLWVVNINDNTHKGNYNIKGSSLTFGDTTSEGVTINIDGREIVVNSQGTAVTN